MLLYSKHNTPKHYYNKSELKCLDGNGFTLFNNAVDNFTLYLWGHSRSKSQETTDQGLMIYQKQHSNAKNGGFSKSDNYLEPASNEESKSSKHKTSDSV